MNTQETKNAPARKRRDANTSTGDSAPTNLQEVSDDGKGFPVDTGDDPHTLALCLLGAVQLADRAHTGESARYRMEQWDRDPTHATVYYELVDDRYTAEVREVVCYVGFDPDNPRVESTETHYDEHPELHELLVEQGWSLSLVDDGLHCAKCDGLGGWTIERGFTAPPAESTDELDVVCSDCCGEGVV
ncbi:MAG: hypothetical protein U5L04_02530 [Trueperaceae bacterium]|nr:hypothetical protein [Trueperaceae bacterium]